MKNLKSFSLCLFLVLTVSIGCGAGNSDTDLAPPQADATTASAPEVQSFSGEVLETMVSGGYTYVLVATDTEQFWAASNEFQVEVGDRVTVPIESPMADFRSESLDREFELIYFASKIMPEGTAPGGAMGAMHGGAMGGGMMSGHTTAADASVEVGTIATPEGGLTIAAIWADRKGLAGKTVVVSGKVVKYNGGIMGTNWLHIQDGSGSAADGTNDLTVTSSTPVAVGDIVTVTGAVTVDKDFGSGYRYATIIMDGEVATH